MLKPGIRPRADGVATARVGGGAPPILTDAGWLTLWHGVEPKGVVGIYRTYWSILDRADPTIVVRHGAGAADRGQSGADRADRRTRCTSATSSSRPGSPMAGDHYIVASGEADLACRITHIAKIAFA